MNWRNPNTVSGGCDNDIEALVQEEERNCEQRVGLGWPAPTIPQLSRPRRLVHAPGPKVAFAQVRVGEADGLTPMIPLQGTSALFVSQRLGSLNGRSGETGGHKGRENRRRLLGDSLKSLSTSLEFGRSHWSCARVLGDRSWAYFWHQTFACVGYSTAVPERESKGAGEKEIKTM